MAKCKFKECCCKCDYQKSVKCHPWNKIGRGPISKTFGYVCFGLYLFEDSKALIFYDHKHSNGGCELFICKNKNKGVS